MTDDERPWGDRDPDAPRVSTWSTFSAERKRLIIILVGISTIGGMAFLYIDKF